jgi:hypothetical protein
VCAPTAAKKGRGKYGSRAATARLAPESPGKGGTRVCYALLPASTKVLNSRLLYLAAVILEAIKGYSRAIAQLCHLAVLLNNK